MEESKGELLCIYVLFLLMLQCMHLTNTAFNRKKAGKRHNTGHKGRARVNRLAQSAPISEKKIENRMRVLIGG